MIVSNEPGYYRTGQFGIRIENLELVMPADAIAGGERPMLGFETLTLIPIDTRLVDTSLLARDEIAWLDAYHARVPRGGRPASRREHPVLARAGDPAARPLLPQLNPNGPGRSHPRDGHRRRRPSRGPHERLSPSLLRRRAAIPTRRP